MDEPLLMTPKMMMAAAVDRLVRAGCTDVQWVEGVMTCAEFGEQDPKRHESVLSLEVRAPDGSLRELTFCVDGANEELVARLLYGQADQLARHLESNRRERDAG